MARAADIERLYASYGKDIEFVIVYIREAHPEQLREGQQKAVKTGVIGRPKTIEERVILATECVTEYKFTLPMVIDGIDQKVAMAYDARTVRTTITDKDGKVAYYAARGPFGFSIAEIERALKKIAAHGGYMPPPPPIQWGAAVNGLRYGIAIDPPGVKVGDDVLVMMKFENGALGKVSVNFDCIMPYTFPVEIFGDKGTVKDNRIWSHKFPGQKGWVEIPSILPDTADVAHHPFQGEIDDFVDAILNDRESHCNLEDAIHTHEVAFAAMECYKTGRPVNLPIV